MNMDELDSNNLQNIDLNSTVERNQCIGKENNPTIVKVLPVRIDLILDTNSTDHRNTENGTRNTIDPSTCSSNSLDNIDSMDVESESMISNPARTRTDCDLISQNYDSGPSNMIFL